MRTLLGILLAIGGAALAWLLKGKFRQAVVHERFIILTSKKGSCGIKDQPARVKLERGRGDQVHWIIRNPPNSGSACDRPVKVCIGKWKQNNVPVQPPVVDLDDENLCRSVPQPQTETIRAKSKPDAEGLYSYEVLIDGDVALDPMIEIVV